MGGTTEKAALLDAIERNFPAQPVPAKIAGRESTYSDEYAYVAAYFKGRTWTKVTLEDLWKDYPGPPDACLCFMSPEGFRYFLPAYLSLFLRRHHDADSVGDAAVYALMPTNDRLLTDWQAERFAQFNASQRKVIRDFLKYVLEHHQDDYGGFDFEAAMGYWKDDA